MSSYAELRLGTWHLDSSRNDVNSIIIRVFRESDKRIYTINRAQSHLYYENVSDDDDSDEKLTVVEYSTSARSARDRLDLMGYTRQIAEAGFNKAVHQEIEQLEQSLNMLHVRNREVLMTSYEKALGILRRLGVEQWMEQVRRIREEGLKPKFGADYPPYSDYPPVLYYMLCMRPEYYGFHGDNFYHFLRLVLETCPDEEQLVYDLTDLILGGWVDTSSQLVDYAEYLISSNFAVSQRIIVITEGDTDRWILERSLRLLYPHLADYFHFFDFIGSRVGGGAGELSRLIKAFSGAGIIHRVLALFDNDTGARAALKSIDLETLPKNIVVRQYPDLPLAQNYPTLGPSGMLSMDVNGLAGSIELYLGQDVLGTEVGELTPVQWRGYDAGLGRYQGEIMSKDEILRRFEVKLKACEASPERISSFDWSGIKSVINTMRSAFHFVDAEDILPR